MKLEKFLPVHRYSVGKFSYSCLPRVYWFLTISIKPLKPVLGAWKLLHFLLVLMNRLSKTESAVFVYCRFSLFLEDPYRQIILNTPFSSLPNIPEQTSGRKMALGANVF